MADTLRSRPQPRATRRVPAYPRAVGAGLLLLATACGGSAPVASGPAGHPTYAPGAPAATSTIATDPGPGGPVVDPPDPVMLDGEAPAPYVEGE